MKTRTILVVGALLAGLSVGLGAFGAHGLKALVSPTQVDTFKTGVQYQMYHAFALLIMGLAALKSGRPVHKLAAWAFIAGIACFSGSLYLFTIQEAMGMNKSAWIGPITPIGGLLFLVGWVTLALDFSKNAE